MTKAVDPFEEFLRKKKVEQLEEQIRQEGGQPSSADGGDEESLADDWAPFDPDASPEQTERVKDEMNDFFAEGGSAGAELFERAQNIDGERVDEIKDAIEDVFEEDPDATQIDDGADDTFKDFFKEVQTTYVAEDEPQAEPEELATGLVLEPETGSFEDEPLTADFPLPDEAGAEERMESAAEPVAASEPESPRVVITPEPLDAQPQPVATEVAEAPLNMAEILQPLLTNNDLDQRTEALTRLVIRLIEHANVPEEQIIEALIKSGVSF